MDKDKQKERIRFTICFSLIQIALIVAFAFGFLPKGSFSTPFLWLTCVTIVGCIGFLKITCHPLQRFPLIVGSWILMWMFCYAFYYGFFLLDLRDITGDDVVPYFPEITIEAANIPIMMLTVGYVLNKGFLRIENITLFTIIGILLFSGNQIFINVVLEMHASTGMSVFMCGSFYGFLIRMSRKAPYTLTQQLKLTKAQSIGGILVSMIFFPEVAFRTDMIPTLAAANTFMCLVCCFLASVAIQLICFDRFRPCIQSTFLSMVAAAVMISTSAGIIQNLAIPSVLGCIVGLTGQLVFRRQQSWVKNQPSYLLQTFFFPAVVGALLTSVFYSLYTFTSYNKIPDFPYPRLQENPFQFALKELGLILSSFIITSAGAGIYLLLEFLFINLLPQEFVWVDSPSIQEQVALTK